MAASSSDGDEIVGINVTPLVDVVLVLLIIFMVTAKLVMSQAMPLDLPKAATAGEAQTMLTVAIDADGNVRVNDSQIQSDDDFTQRARVALRDEPDLRAVLSASERVPHGRVMHALDLLRACGITKIAFAAEKVERAP